VPQLSMAAKLTNQQSELSSRPALVGRRCWVVALDCEARPLIHSLRMRRREEFRGWVVYANEAKEDWLVVSGIGRAASAAAVGFLGGVAGQAKNTTWWNVGVAGHRSLAVGEMRRAGKIIDASSERAFYPMAVAKRGPVVEVLNTVGLPSLDYPDEGMVDMEASGFCATAARLASRERIQVLKVISDNAENPFPKKPDPRMAESLVKEALPEILAFADATRELADSTSETEDDRSCDSWVEVVTEQVRMSVTQARQLRRRVERMQALGGVDEEQLLGMVDKGVNARGVLRLLDEELSERALEFSD
jgi:hypothetical protein